MTTNSQVIEKPELGPLISPRRDINEPVFNWHQYKHGFSKGLVDYLINYLGLKPHNWVLDPFCGGGTTMLACKRANINCIGYDILPFAVLLSNVKTREYNKESLEEQLRRLKDTVHTIKIANIPDLVIIPKAFSHEVQKEIISIRQAILGLKYASDIQKDFFLLALLSILEGISNTTKSGGFLRIVHKNNGAKNTYDLFFDRVGTMIQDIASSKFDSNGIICNATVSDARELPSDQLFDAVITSPPYLNRHDYTRIYSLELAFGFLTSSS